MLDLKKGFKRLLLESDINQTQLGEKLDMTKANVSRLLNKDDFRIHGDIERIASVLGYSVRLQFIDEETGKVIDCD